MRSALTRQRPGHRAKQRNGTHDPDASGDVKRIAVGVVGQSRALQHHARINRLQGREARRNASAPNPVTGRAEIASSAVCMICVRVSPLPDRNSKIDLSLVAILSTSLALVRLRSTTAAIEATVAPITIQSKRVSRTGLLPRGEAHQRHADNRADPRSPRERDHQAQRISPDAAQYATRRPVLRCESARPSATGTENIRKPPSMSGFPYVENARWVSKPSLPHSAGSSPAN